MLIPIADSIFLQFHYHFLEFYDSILAQYWRTEEVLQVHGEQRSKRYWDRFCTEEQSQMSEVGLNMLKVDEKRRSIIVAIDNTLYSIVKLTQLSCNS